MTTRRAGGFTLMEIMVSLVVVVIGMLGIMALIRTTSRVNRIARQLASATSCAVQVMEDLRATDLTTLGTSGAYPDVVASDGTTYHQAYTVANIAGTSTVVLITSTATFADDVDGSTHTASLQLARTTLEKL